MTNVAFGGNMSTKVTIKSEWQGLSQPGFHLYEECLSDDDGPVYLELNGCPFTATSSGNDRQSNIEIEIPRKMAIALGLLPD